MSTTGIAHHQRGTFPIIDDAAECAARTARYAAKDAAYRAALRLGEGEPIPRAIGVTRHNGAGASTPLPVSGGRMRGRPAVEL